MADKSDNLSSFMEKGWLTLDNAAKLFPAIISEDLTSVFRITASLNEPVNYRSLREAVSITSARFPYFNVSLGSGLFWHFLEFNKNLPHIQVEGNVPCTAFALKRKNEPLYRIIAKENRISVEFIHILTDGGGALEYLKSLLYTYLVASGKDPGSPGDIILPSSPVSEEEFEDGYKRFFRKLPPPLKLPKAWHLPFLLNERPRLRITRAIVSVDQMLELARTHKVSITEYFVAVYLFSLQKIFLETAGKHKSRKKVLRIELPVNMRKKCSSRTMRNFSLFVLPELDMRLGTYTFDEVVHSVHHQLQFSSDVKQISRFLSQNVGYEKLFFIRMLPLFIKKLAIASIYRGFASKRFTGLVTNLGVISIPPVMETFIDSFEIIPPPPNLKVKLGCAMVTFKDSLRITFLNLTGSPDVERLILRHFIDAGVHVRVQN